MVTRLPEYYPRLAGVGVIAFLMVVVGFFQGRLPTIPRLIEFIVFLGQLVLVSIAIALFIVVVIRRINPIPISELKKSNKRSIPLADVTEARLPANRNSIRLTIEADGDIATEELYFLRAMTEERRRAIDLFESYGIPVDAD